MIRIKCRMNMNKKFILYTLKIENHFINHNKRLTNLLHNGEIERKDMRKEVKSLKLVTAPLTWCDSTRGEAVKSEMMCGMCGVRCLKPDL